MNLDQYTDDAICRSMGLPAFIEPDWSPLVLRLLLKPSFHPEVCVTLAGADAVLSVVALVESLWSQSIPCELPTFRERSLVAPQLAHQLYSGFSTAFEADRDPEGRMVCVDGMPLTCCLLDSAGMRQFACNPYRPAASAFVASLIHAAWQACSGAGVRNALANCGKYVRLELPREPEVAPPKMFRIAVLGTTDNRADFFEKLQQKKRAGLTSH